MKPEIRFAELRLEDGRTLRGTVIRYGDIGSLPWGGKERFEPGSLRFDDVILNSQHDRNTPLARTNGGGLMLRADDSGVMLEAELPETGPASDVLELVRRGVLRGLSVEFHAISERQEGDVRVIEQAELVGIGVVDTAAYPASEVEARRKQHTPAGYHGEYWQ